MITVRRVISALVALLLCLSAGRAAASTVRYRTDAELVQLSERVVLARALRQRTERPNPVGAIYTVTTLAVLEDLTGIPGDTIEVWELGGVYGGEGMYLGGAVEYRIGGDVLVCLERGPRGLRSVAMGFSKFDVTAAAGRAGSLSRNLAAVDVVGGVVQGQDRSLAEFRALVAELRRTRAIVNASAAAMRPDDQPRFTTLSSSNPRWFEADSGTPVVWYQNLSFGSNPLTSGDVVAETQNSLAAWTNPSTASIILQYVSTTSQINPTGPWSGIPSNAGVISWEDPEGNISGSTLAVGGGFFFTNAGTINGVIYGRFTRGYVLFQNAADLSAGFRQAPNFTRVLEHEIGHTIGLGHTAVGGTPNPNIMFASPAIGGVASGTAVNFGWGITPKVNGVATCKIQPAGVQVSIDSGALQLVNFGANRTDIAGAFPGFSNTASAGGSFVFDTTVLANGVHTIGWLITDDCGRADGVGSRFFTVQNGSQVAPAEFRLKAEPFPDAEFRLKAEATRGSLRAEASSLDSVVSAFRRNSASDEPVLVSRGYGELPVRVGPDGAGERRVRVAPGARIEVRLPHGFEHAYQLVNGERRALPIGASWDAAANIFAWQPAPGFLGEFLLVFAGDGEQLRVRVSIDVKERSGVDATASARASRAQDSIPARRARP